MTLFEILSDNDRILVWADENGKVIYTWNQAHTLQAWYQSPGRSLATGTALDSWEEVDLRTLSFLPENASEARRCARIWDAEIGG